MTKTNNAAANIVASRGVHRALAKTVELAGCDQSKALYGSAKLFNTNHFGGQLLPIAVMIAAPASPSAWATHEPRTPEGVECLVKIAPYIVRASERLAFDALLHEMIHIWQTETDNREDSYDGHGPKFAAKCNEIGEKFGLPKVGVKGRDGLPNCAQWPVNVRPEGYYGESVKAKKVVSRAKKAGQKRVKKAKVSKVEKVVRIIQSLTEKQQAEVREAMGW